VPNKGLHRRPYAYEILILVHLAILWPLLARHDFSILAPVRFLAFTMVPAFLVDIFVGVGARSLIASTRKRTGTYLRSISRTAWLTDVVRMLVFGVLTMFVYGWIKLVIPILHPRLFDQELWDLDRLLFFGYSPNILLIDLFSNRFFLHVIDQAYARIFFISMLGTFAFFFSEPSRRLRLAFITGNATLWLTGAWLYLLIPSLGPAYRFPDVWLAHADSLRVTQHFQAALMHNYQNVLRLAHDPRLHIDFSFGVAAFPSMHVAFQAFAFLWMRRLWKSGEVIMSIFTLTILLGSVITGWHYLIDGIAGIALAAIVYFAVARIYRIDRALALRDALRK
jgi:hypothetical protein